MNSKANEYEIIRGMVDGKEKYCRIPIRSKLADYMQTDGLMEVNAETILSMPKEKAAAVIDAIIEDWLYWLRRAGELYIYAVTGVQLDNSDEEVRTEGEL